MGVTDLSLDPVELLGGVAVATKGLLAVTGATGKLGRLVVEQLLQQVEPGRIVAAVRSPGKAADLAARGVIVREADYSRPETLEPAFQGVERLLLISSSEIGQRLAHHRNVIAAAKAAGVSWLAYTSLLHADTSPLSLAEEHRQTEQAVRESGLAFVILRNGWYTENYEDRVRGAVAQGILVGCSGEGRISSAARADYAAAAVVVLTSDQHNGKVYELAGDEAWTMYDLAAELSLQTGREISYRDVTPQEFAAILTGAGLPEPIAQMLAGWEVAIAQGAVFDDSHTLSSLIGRPTTPLSDVVRSWLT